MSEIPNLHGRTLPIAEAAAHATTVYNAIEDLCKQVYVAGSIRRGKTQTDDADLVCLPHDRPRLLARLDKLVAAGTLTKAVSDKGRSLWGDKLRSFSVEGFKVELFIAGEHNIGYILWLRTGPGNANQLVMRQWQTACKFEAREGYLWRHGTKISVPDEATMFRLLRMPHIRASKRNEYEYKRLRNRLPVCPDSDLVFVDVPPVPVQKAMF